MRRFLAFIPLLLLCGCASSVQQDRANKVAENYIRLQFGNSHHPEPVSFSDIEEKRYTTAVDSEMNYSGVEGDECVKLNRFADSSNSQRPNLANRSLKDFDDIRNGKLDYYSLVYTFHIDSAGQKKLRRFRFNLDTGYNIFKAQDITFKKN